jgi:hypothetical protein
MSAHTFKVGDKVTYQDNIYICTVLAVHGEFLWLDHPEWVLTTALANRCTLYVEPPVQTRWVVTTERRVPKEGDQILVENGRVVTVGRYASEERHVIVSVERAEMSDRLSDEQVAVTTDGSLDPNAFWVALATEVQESRATLAEQENLLNMQAALLAEAHLLVGGGADDSYIVAALADLLGVEL